MADDHDYSNGPKYNHGKLVRQGTRGPVQSPDFDAADQHTRDRDLPTYLEDLAQQMIHGDYTPSSEAILLTRDEDSGIIIVNRWGTPTRLLDEAAEIERLRRN